MKKYTGPPALPEQVFFDDPAVDRLMGVLMTLAMDHYVLRDRVRALEAQLSRTGHLDAAALAQAPSESEQAADNADAAAFVEALLRPLLGLQEAAGTPGHFTLRNAR